LFVQEEGRLILKYPLLSEIVPILGRLVKTLILDAFVPFSALVIKPDMVIDCAWIFVYPQIVKRVSFSCFYFIFRPS